MAISAIPGIAELWAETLGDPRVCIAVLDGPVDLSHPSLAGAKLTQLSTTASSGTKAGSASRHGTHVASVLFGQHEGPVLGIAPHCRGLIVPVFDDGADDSVVPCSELDLARAISQATQNGANVINISGGQLSASGQAHPLLANAVRRCTELGVLIVAAAGNEGCACLHVPGSLSSVIAVGAMNAHGAPLHFSNWGEIYQDHGVLAPGENIKGAVPGGGTITQTGTSFATPIVSGLCGLLLSLQRKYGKPLDPKVVQEAIFRSAQGCEHQKVFNCRRLLTGRLNIRGSVSFIMRGIRNMAEEPALVQDVAMQTNEALDASFAPEHSPSAPSTPTSRMNQIDASSPPPLRLPASPAGLLPANGTVAELDRVNPSACGCGCKGAAPQLVYALGTVNYDFGSEARRDWFIAAMKEIGPPIVPPTIPPTWSDLSPYSPADLETFFQGHPVTAADPMARTAHPEAAEALIWTLNIDATPIYAVLPKGPYAVETYAKLRQFLTEQQTAIHGGQDAERAAVPGHIVGQVRLLSGQTVPVIQPDLRGMFNWTTTALSAALATALHLAGADLIAELNNFLDRVYYEFRNLGLTSQERALNYAGTVALLFAKSIQAELTKSYHLDTIAVERSAVCRPESDCWDVKLTFFNPKKQLEESRRVHFFPIDVSDVIPVALAKRTVFFVR